jgi:hypothetical protein
MILSNSAFKAAIIGVLGAGLAGCVTPHGEHGMHGKSMNDCSMSCHEGAGAEHPKCPMEGKGGMMDGKKAGEHGDMDMSKMPKCPQDDHAGHHPDAHQ